MKVGFVSYSTLFQRNGGLQNQILCTKFALEERGASVSIISDYNDKIEDFDLIHVFGINHANYTWVIECSRQGIPVVLSPIFQSNYSILDRIKIRFFECLSGFLLRGIVGNNVYSTMSASKEALLLANKIYVQTAKERESLVKIFGRKLYGKSEIIPNGVHNSFFGKNIQNLDHGRPYIFVPGAIYEHKNQLKIAEVTQNLGIDVILAGEILDKEYFSSVVNAENPHVKYVGVIRQNSFELAELYRNAFTTVLYSKGETFGLVAIESLAVGTPVLITDQAAIDTKAFQDGVDVVPISDPKVLKSKIEINLSKNYSREKLSQSVVGFSWPLISEKLLESYRTIKGLKPNE